MYFIPACRGRGYGAAAFEIIEREAKKENALALHLLVDPRNERAVRLYRSAHFEQSHRVYMTKLI